MSGLMTEFLGLAVIHLLAVISPGPDFAVSVRQSIRYGRVAGIGTALGIGAGISVHVIYTLFGVGALMHTTPWLLQLAEAMGSAYLLYLGISFIRDAGSHITDAVDNNNEEQRARSLPQAFVVGFLTNATNPKATLFFLAVFTTLVSATTPLRIQILYGIWMCLVNALWFILVTLIFTRPTVRQRFIKIGPWFERLMGFLLIAFSVRLIWHSAQRLI